MSARGLRDRIAVSGQHRPEWKNCGREARAPTRNASDGQGRSPRKRAGVSSGPFRMTAVTGPSSFASAAPELRRMIVRGARAPRPIRSPCRPCRRRPASRCAAVLLRRSATIASVVISRPATLAASCSAVRTTFVGSTMPALTRSTYSRSARRSRKCSTSARGACRRRSEASTPEFSTIWRSGACIALRTIVDTRVLVVVVALEPARTFWRREARAAAGNDAFLDGRLGGMSASSTRSFLLFHFDFRRTADADDRDAAGELRQTFLQLLLVVVGGGLLDLRA